MPRPLKLRQVAYTPNVTFFKPAGVPMAVLQDVTLTLEEVEAIRLKDIEDLHQEDCARQMGVSRATFHQIVKSARGKLADAILNGKAIRVEGGSVAFPGGRFRCRRDGHEWALPPGPLPGASSVTCPECSGHDVLPVHPGFGPWHGGWGRRGAGARGGAGPWSRGRMAGRMPGQIPEEEIET
jgi:predicted DNA-binding protein (UPF0251 family)